MIRVSDLLTVNDFDLKNTDKFSVIHVDGKQEIFKHTNLEKVIFELLDNKVNSIQFIDAV